MSKVLFSEQKSRSPTTGTDSVMSLFGGKGSYMYLHVHVHVYPVHVSNPGICLLYTSDAADE